LLLAEIVKGDIEAVAHLLVRRCTEANPARLGQRFEPGGNVDAVAEDVVILDDDVAGIDAHAKFDASLCRFFGVPPGPRALHSARPAHRIADADNPDQPPFAGGLDDPATMLGFLRIPKLAAARPQCGEGAPLTGLHQP